MPSAVKYDLLLAGGLLVDPVNGIQARKDIGILHGSVEDVEDEIPQDQARSVIDLSNRVVIPGAIDPHVHVAGTNGPLRTVGHRMVAESGIVTALDLSCTPDRLIESLQNHGAGLNVGGLFGLSTMATLDGDNDPSREHIQTLLDGALAGGAIGLKVLGAGISLTPDAAGNAIDLCNRAKTYVAFHLGTSESGSNIKGVRELPFLLGNNRVHVAHVNSYCRGLFDNAANEARETLDILRSVRSQIVSESYLARPNGCNGLCEGDEVLATDSRDSLRLLGYPDTRAGLKKSILEGVTSIVAERGGRGELVTGTEGARLFEDAGTHVTVSFPVNGPVTTMLCATGRDIDGRFTVDALSTDGGVLPRNVLLEKGMNLVRYGALTLSELAMKSSANAAAMLGLWRKGHLGHGADADVTVLDLAKDKPVMSFNAGQMIMKDGISLARDGRLITTPRGEKAAQAAGLDYTVVEIASSGLYAPRATSLARPGLS